jgi:hypothetical protein
VENCRDLSELDVAGSSITDFCLKYISTNAKLLTRLIISRTRFMSQEGVVSLGRCAILIELVVYNCGGWTYDGTFNSLTEIIVEAHENNDDF